MALALPSGYSNALAAMSKISATDSGIQSNLKFFAKLFFKKASF